MRAFNRRRGAFTLIELLVVIGVMTVLVGLLLPSLNNARRQARKVKCMANLRSIGNGFFQYSKDYDRTFPVAVHHPSATRIPIGPLERRWYDLISEYVSGMKMKDIDDLEKVRENSVLWGCPEWGRAEVYLQAGDRYRPGYGMNYYNTFTELRSRGIIDLNQLAYIVTDRGRYIRQYEWTKPSERGLLVDSITHIVQTPPTMDRDNGTWFPYSPINATDPALFYADSGRHDRPGIDKNDQAEKRRSYTRKTMNMLFCDGHVETVSIREAWNAINNPGDDRAGN